MTYRSSPDVVVTDRLGVQDAVEEPRCVAGCLAGLVESKFIAGVTDVTTEVRVRLVDVDGGYFLKVDC